jgi:dTMP kinase
MLTPITFSLVHAADFVDRMERQMLPALKAGAIVLADRYIYTAFGRDVARGVDPMWVREMYSFAIQPTVAFYFRVPLEESLKRILTGRPKLKYYEAGMDIGLHEDAYTSYEMFQGRILEEYDKMVDEFNLEVIDATLPLLEQHEIVIETVEQHLEAALKAAQSPFREVLTSESLQGRYLTHQVTGDSS